VSGETLISWGDSFFEEEALSDAVDFYVRADAIADGSSSRSREPLEKIKSIAMEEGDLFLFTKVCRALGQEAVADELRSLAEHAGDLGKKLYAVQALARAGVDVSLEEHRAPA
jgi:hypothetical protein